MMGDVSYFIVFCIRISSFKYSNILLFFFQYIQTDPPTSKGLAALVIQLIQFQEDNLGKNVSKPPLTRLPVSMKMNEPQLVLKGWLNTYGQFVLFFTFVILTFSKIIMPYIPMSLGNDQKKLVLKRINECN